MTALGQFGLNLNVTAHMKNVRSSVSNIVDDISQGFFEITHNSFALLGLAVVFAVITLTARPDLRQAGEFKLMVIRYGVAAGATSLSPETYHTAAEVTALPKVGDLTAWQRVTAVRVCLLTRTQENSRTEDKAGALRTYANCRGANVTYAASDRTVYKKYERVFAIRNNLTGTY